MPVSNIQILGKKSWLRASSLLLLLLLPVSYMGAQVIRSKEKDLVANVAGLYIELCRNIDSSQEKIARFASLFADSIELPCDYRIPPGPLEWPEDYYDDMACFFWDNAPVVIKVSIHIADTTPVLYAQDGDHYFAWIQKDFQYVFRDTAKHIPVWTLLHLVKTKRASGMIITRVEMPATVLDVDNDQIADTLDGCPRTPRGDTVDLTGCTFRQGINPSNQDSLNLVKKADPLLTKLLPSDSSKRNASPFSFDVRPGSFFTGTFPTSWASRNLLDFTTNKWNGGAGLASPVGYSLDASMHYRSKTMPELFLGVKAFYNNMEEEYLRIHVKNYLGNQQINYRNVEVSATGYYSQFVYTGFLGTFRQVKRHSWKVSVLAGAMFSGMLTQDKLRMTVTYPDGPATQEVSLQYPPFGVLGGKIHYQLTLGRKKRVSLLLSGEYMQGRSGQKPRTLTFTGASGVATITSPEVKWVVASLGFNYNFTSNKK